MCPLRSYSSQKQHSSLVSLQATSSVCEEKLHMVHSYWYNCIGIPIISFSIYFYIFLYVRHKSENISYPYKQNTNVS